MNYKRIIQRDLTRGPWRPLEKRWILAAAGAAMSLASSIFGASKAAKEQEEAERRQKAKEAADNARYLYQKNVSELDTARGQNTKRMAEDAAKRLWKRAAGASAMGGATAEEAALAKEQGNRMVGDAVAQIASQDTARQDRAEEMKAQADAQNTQTDMQLAQQRASNISTMATGMSNAFAQAAGAADEAFGSKAAAVTQPESTGDTSSNAYALANGGIVTSTTRGLSASKGSWIQKAASSMTTKPGEIFSGKSSVMPTPTLNTPQLSYVTLRRHGLGNTFKS